MRARALLVTSLLLIACSRSQPKLDDRVAQRLAEEGATPEQVSVSADGRIVRLDGVVGSETERERLERAARRVAGVLAIDNRLVIQASVTLTKGSTSRNGSAVADERVVDKRVRLRDEVAYRLETAGVEGANVEVCDETIFLRGRVRPEERAAVERAAKAAAPEMTIVNELVIMP